MSYSEPQLNIFQEFVAALDADVTPLYACVMGPKYGLHRYGVSGEEESIGAYDPAVSTAYPWPGKVAGSVVDQASAKVIAQDALLQIYNGGDFEVPAGQVGENEIETSTLVLQSKNGYSRSAVFGNRDLAVGDKVKVAWDAEEIQTAITAIRGEIGSVIGAAAADANNQAPTADAFVDNVTGVVGGATLAITENVAGTLYNGIVDGYPQEIYTLTITTAGALGTAKAAVVSTSGKDDVTEVIVDDGMDVGTRGLVIDIANTGTDLAVGDVIVITKTQDYAVPVITSGGAYSGAKATQYIVEIVEGGVIGTDTPKLRVTTTNGYDIQGETAIVAGALVIGNYGITLTFVATEQLNKGDAWTVEATPEEERAMKTIVMGANLSANGNDATDADVLTVTLMLEDTVEIDSEYFTKDAVEITVLADAAVEDLYGDTGNDLPIVEAELFVDYREHLSGTTELGSIEDPLDVETVLGPSVTDNPLSYGMKKSLENANGVAVYYCTTPTDDLAGYTAALDRISIEDVIWSLVPLTKDADVLAITKAFILDQSSPINNNWKKGWFSSNAKQEQSFYTEEGGSNLQATIEDDLSGSNYVNVNAPGAKFLDKVGGPVVAGDVLLYNAHPVNGETIWDEMTIASVTDNENLVLQSSAIEMTILADIEIWRIASLSDYAGIIAAESTAFGNRRINNIWPDTITDDLGEEVEGYFLCAALAAYRSASAPHQPLTRGEITGFGNPERTLQFSRAQLNEIAEGGTWIVTADLEGAVFTRHQLTTDMTSIETQEDSVTSNLDSISRVYRDNFEPLIGKSNVTPDLLELINGRIFTSFKYIHNLPYSRELGPQMLSYELLELAQDPVLKSKVRIRIKPELPLPLNNLDLFFYIGG